MATKYVNSAATGAKDGTSWTDAWTSIGAALVPGNYSESGTALAADDLCLVHSGHNKTYNSDTTFVFPDRVRFVSVDKDSSDAYTTGATENAGTGYFLRFNSNTSVRMEGITLIYGDLSANYWLGTASHAAKCWLKDCTIDLAGPIISYGSGELIFEDGTIDLNSNSITALFQSNGSSSIIVVLKNTAFSAVAASTDLFRSDLGVLSVFYVDACDLSAFDAIVSTLGTLPVVGQITRSKVPSTIYGATGTSRPYMGHVMLSYCDTATLTAAPFGLEEREERSGEVTTDTTYVLSSGAANDGTRDYSYKMTPVTTYTNEEDPLELPPLRTWHAGSTTGSKTLTVYFCSDGTLDKNEFFIEVYWNDEATTSTSPQGEFASTKPDYGVSATLTTTSSLWDGSPTYQYKLTQTVNPYFAGEIEVRCFLAKSGTTAVYVHPIPELE